MAERNITKRPRSFGHEFVDMLQKHWSKKGTASFEMVFKTPDGTYYKADKVVTLERNLTCIELKDIGSK